MPLNIEIELIEKYLSDKLTLEEKKVFDHKNKTDKVFSEELQFRKNLRIAAERITTAEFKSKFHNIHSEFQNKKKKKVHLYYVVSMSAAAVILLFLLIINPLNNTYKISRFVAEAKHIGIIKLRNISPDNLRSDEEVETASTLDLEVAFIIIKEDNKYSNSYFFNENVLYLFKQPYDYINFFYEISDEGNHLYYLNRNNYFFRFNQEKDKKLNKFIPIDFGKKKDKDGDGIPDFQDGCPNVAGLKEFSGCPDSDKDGLPDDLDICPNKFGPSSNKGCPWPDMIPAEVRELIMLNTKGIEFESNSNKIMQHSYVKLDDLAKIMKDYPGTKFSIYCYSDKPDSPEFENGLANARAESIKRYFIQKGIVPSRIDAKYFGLQSIDINDITKEEFSDRGQIEIIVR